MVNDDDMDDDGITDWIDWNTYTAHNDDDADDDGLPDGEAEALFRSKLASLFR